MQKVKSAKVMIALAVLAAVFVLSAMSVQMCEAREINELHIGYQPSTHQIAEMTAMEKGWWKRDLTRFGIEKVTDFEFPSGPPEMHAMMVGDIDVAYVGVAPPISAVDKGLDAKIVAAVQINGSALVLLPELAANYTSAKDIKGLKIATFPPGSVQDIILKKWLKDNGLDPEKDADIIPMESQEAISAIAARTVDGVFLPSPNPTIIEMEGAGRIVVLSGEMMPNHACCCLLVSGELIREHPEIVEQIIRTHINATEYNKAHPDEAAEIFARKMGCDVEMVRKSFKRSDMKWIHNPHLEIPSTIEYARVHYEMGYTDKLLTRDDLFDTRFYDKISPPILTVSITTDEFKYSPSDTMTITLDISNPTEDSVTFQWYWGVPHYSIWSPVISSPIPPDYDDTLDFSLTIPDWGPTSFGTVFYVQLLDARGEVLDADATWWAYSPGREAMPAAEVDITKEIEKTVKRIELPS